MNEHIGHLSVLPIVFAANEKFSIPLILAIESLLRVAGPASVYEVHVMDDGVSSLAKDYLISLQDKFDYTITFHDVSQLAVDMPTTYYFPKVTYARFLLPQFFAETSHRRVFYSDADVFFARDIAPVYNMDMQGCPLAGVQELNCLPPVVRREFSSANVNYVEDWAARFGIPVNVRGAFYVNAGTVLMDIKEFEEGGYAQRCLDECSKIDLKKAPLLDQDVLNYVCWGRIALLPPIYGAIPIYGKFYTGQEYYPQTCKYSLPELAEANNNPAIIHFAGQKPRVLEGARYSLEQPFIDFWQKSAWRDYMPYAPRIGSMSPSRFIKQNVPISTQLGVLRKELIKYTVASCLPLPKRRHYAGQRAGLRRVLQNARPC